MALQRVGERGFHCPTGVPFTVEVVLSPCSMWPTFRSLTKPFSVGIDSCRINRIDKMAALVGESPTRGCCIYLSVSIAEAVRPESPKHVDNSLHHYGSI